MPSAERRARKESTRAEPSRGRHLRTRWRRVVAAPSTPCIAFSLGRLRRGNRRAQDVRSRPMDRVIRSSPNEDTPDAEYLRLPDCGVAGWRGGGTDSPRSRADGRSRRTTTSSAAPGLELTRPRGHFQAAVFAACRATVSPEFRLKARWPEPAPGRRTDTRVKQQSNPASSSTAARNPCPSPARCRRCARRDPLRGRRAAARRRSPCRPAG